MKANVCSYDRIIRIVAGVALIAAAASGTLGAWAWIGVIPLATGILAVCPAYMPFGLSTCSVGNHAKH